MRSSTVEECLTAQAHFIETLDRLPIADLGRFKAMIEQDLGCAVFHSPVSTTGKG